MKTGIRNQFRRETRPQFLLRMAQEARQRHSQKVAVLLEGIHSQEDLNRAADALMPGRHDFKTTHAWMLACMSLLRHGEALGLAFPPAWDVEMQKRIAADAEDNRPHTTFTTARARRICQRL